MTLIKNPILQGCFFYKSFELYLIDKSIVLNLMILCIFGLILANKFKK